MTSTRAHCCEAEAGSGKGPSDQAGWEEGEGRDAKMKKQRGAGKIRRGQGRLMQWELRERDKPARSHMADFPLSLSYHCITGHTCHVLTLKTGIEVLGTVNDESCGEVMLTALGPL